MGEAIGEMLPAAVGVAISPLPIVAAVLMLASARSTGVAFVAGWVVGVAAAGTVLLLVAGAAGASEDGEAATSTSWVKLALAGALLLLAGRQWRGRPREGDEPALPRWLGALDAFTPVKASAAGVALSALNPKNLVLIAAGMAAVAGTGVPAGEQALAVAVFTVVASVGVAAPLAISIAMGDRSVAVLDRLKTWLARHNAAILTVLFVVIAAKLVGDAIPGLA